MIRTLKDLKDSGELKVGTKVTISRENQAKDHILTGVILKFVGPSTFSEGALVFSIEEGPYMGDHAALNTHEFVELVEEEGEWE